MTALTTAGIAVFSSLGLVALALALLARRYSVAAVIIGWIGLFALTAVLAWITYAGPQVVLQGIGNLTSEISVGNKELQHSGAQFQELEKRVEAIQVENHQIRTDLAAVLRTLGEAQGESAKAKAEAERLIAALESQEVKRTNAERNAAAAITNAAELEKKLLESIAHFPASPKQQDTGIVRRILAYRLETPFYTSQPLEQHALVAGLIGSWYVLRLKLQGKPFIFTDGQFGMPDEVAAEVKESALQLQSGVLAAVEQAAKTTRLFLRGGADSRRLLGAREAPDARELFILPRLPDGNYRPDPQHVLTAVPINNEDLPNLRADWLRKRIQPVLSLGPTDLMILENPPAAGQERTVDLILYVDW
jgi:hypothetical protein